ncbi:unnamed protein product [Paramecium primaurelia]|uniref:SSD domain-containing protein n=1 Tax=Paramecium primaurelia TaxID=5886 RepID=A0A8S1LQ61_PARPR|nr:unnamed protein product [Paramecium primaurelia]
MSGLFYNIGFFGAKYPCLVFVICMTVTGIMSLGLYNLTVLTDPQSLWVSSSSRTYQEQESSAENYGPFYRTNQFILAYQDENWVNVFQKDGLKVIYFLQNIIRNRKVLIGGKNTTLDDLCYRPISAKGCYVPSPMDIWLQDPSLLDKDEDIQFTTLCTESIDVNQTNIPCSDKNGIPIILESVFGGINCEQRVNDTQPCDHCYIQAKTMAVTYLLMNDEFTKKDAEQWEKEVWMDTLDALNKRDYAKLYKYYDKSLMPAPREQLLDQYRVAFMAERSVSDEIDDETNQNAWIVVVSYFMMFMYIGFAIGQFPSKIYNGFTLGLGGIFIVAVSMISSIGMVSYFSIGLTMISLEVIPFLILAIGVDNMFIITHNYKKQKHPTVPERMGYTLKQVGPSITIAAICETLAFLVGSLTKMPALQSFCIQAAVGVFIDYLLQITMFVAFLTLDEQRKKHKRYDLMICKQDTNYQIKEDRKLIQTFFKKHYSPFIQKPACVITTIIIFVALFAISCVGITKLQVGLDEQVSMVEGSNLFNYMTLEKKYIEIGPLAYLILENLDYQNQHDLDLVANLSNSLSQLNETVQPPIYSWVASFNLFIREKAEWTTACETQDIALYDLPTQLKRFLGVRINSPCCQRYGICGETFEADIVLNEQGYVKTSRLRFQHRPIHNSAGYILSLEQTRQVIDKVVKEAKLKDNQKVYPYSMPYVFYDQYSYIRAVAITNVLLALATIFFTMTLVQDVVCAIIVVLFVFLIAFNLIGTIWLTNVIFGGFIIEINAVSVVNLVTCIGLAVEFVAHIVIKFRLCEGKRWERVTGAMSTMGTSVFVGIACTKFIGVAVLGFAPSTLFKLYYFRMYILMVVLGAFNGLVLLPIFLGLFGPQFSIMNIRVKSLINQSDGTNFSSQAKRKTSQY